MDEVRENLSDVLVYSKYARHVPSLERRETWDEVADRYAEMMINEYPNLEKFIPFRIFLF